LNKIDLSTIHIIDVLKNRVYLTIEIGIRSSRKLFVINLILYYFLICERC